MHFCDFWMILHHLVTLPKVGKHLALSQYAISSRYKRPNSRKWPKTSILALWIIQKCVSVTLEWPFMTRQCCQMLENIKYYHSMQHQVDPTDQSPEIGQKPLFWLFGSFKMHFCDIWMILHDLVMFLNAGIHLIRLHYAISGLSNRPKSRKWPKTSFLALWIIQKCVFVTFEWSFMIW